MAEVVILGSGTSNGVPMLGHHYPEGFLDEPKNHRTRASVVVLGPEGNLLVDCTPELRIQMTREQVYEVEATLITHSHADHIMGMDDLRSIVVRTKKAMPVYTLPRYQEDIRRIYNYAFADFPPGVDVPRFELLDVPEHLQVGGLTFRTFIVKHGQVPVIAFRVNDFAYITDVSEIEEKDLNLLHGLKNLVLDAVRFRPHPNHYHYEKAMEIAELIGAETTYFTHLSHDYDHRRFEATLPPNIRLAYDGLRLPL